MLNQGSAPTSLASRTIASKGIWPGKARTPAPEISGAAPAFTLPAQVRLSIEATSSSDFTSDPLVRIQSMNRSVWWSSISAV